MPRVHCVEFFAGVGHIASAFTSKCTAQAFDIERSGAHDLDEPMGIVLALWSVWNLETGGLAHFGIVCKSFCWINSGTHQRSIAFPLGRESLAYVAEGSRLALTTVSWFDSESQGIKEI